jgi:hypothetical protein
MRARSASRLVLASARICSMSPFSLAAIPAARSSMSLMPASSRSPKPRTCRQCRPVDPQTRKREFLKAFERLIEFLTKATGLILDGAAHDSVSAGRSRATPGAVSSCGVCLDLK